MPGMHLKRAVELVDEPSNDAHAKALRLVEVEPRRQAFTFIAHRDRDLVLVHAADRDPDLADSAVLVGVFRRVSDEFVDDERYRHRTVAGNLDALVGIRLDVTVSNTGIEIPADGLGVPAEVHRLD